MGRKFEHLLDLVNVANPPSDVKEMRSVAFNAYIDALESVLPNRLMERTLSYENGMLIFKGDKPIEIPVNTNEGIILIGGGKASAEMAKFLIEKISVDKEFRTEKDIVYITPFPVRGLINIPSTQDFPSYIVCKCKLNGMEYSVEFNRAAHPIPDESGLEGVRKMLKLVEGSPNDTPIIALISGGGSALMPYPAEGIQLDDLKAMNDLMLKTGLAIHEINCIRKHISGFKGGQLAKKVYPRPLVGLIISDVIGNDLQTIASGPTVPDSTTYREAMDICLSYNILDKIPQAIRAYLEDGLKGKHPETPKPGSPFFENVHNLIIGSAESSAKVAEASLSKRGVPAAIYTNSLSGEARDYGRALFLKFISEFYERSGADIDTAPLEMKNLPDFKGELPRGMIGTGEFTVTIRGNGIGGRNQEMLLSFLYEMLKFKLSEKNADGGAASENKRSAEKKPPSIIIISGAFDGIEGNSPAMGAFIDSFIIESILMDDEGGPAGIGLKEIEEALENNDSYSIFKKLGTVLETGYTGTNVNDMTLIIIH